MTKKNGIGFNLYKADSISKKWNKNDFPANYPLISFPELTEIRMKFIAPNDVQYVYFISDIIYFKKNHAFFSFLKTSTGLPGGRFEDIVVIMKKEDGKWIMEQEVYNDPFVNP